MALARETMGLLFKLEADSKPAQTEISQFRAFLGGQASQIKSEVTPALAGATGGFSGMGAAASAAAGPIGLIASALTIAATAATATVAGLFALSRNAAETGTKLFDLADKTGINIRNLDLFRHAALEAGKGIDVVERSFDQFTSRLEQGSKTTGELNKTIKALGLDPKTALQDVNKSLETVVKNLNAIENPAIRGAKAQELFGLRNEAIVPILTRIGESLDAYERRVGNIGKITKEQTEQSKSFDVSLNILKATIGGVAQSVGAQFLPTFQAAIDLVQTMIRFMGEGLLIVLGKAKGAGLGVADAIDVMNAAMRSAPAFVNVLKVAFGEVIEVAARFIGILKEAAKASFALSTGDFQGAFAAGSAAFGGIQNFTQGVGDKTKAALGAAIAETSKQFLQLRSDRAKLSVSGKDKPDLTGGTKTKTGDQAAQDALKLLRIQEQAAQRVADAEIREAQRAFDFKQITIEQLERLTIEAEKRMLAAKEATFAAERREVEQSKLRAGEKAVKLAEIAEREAVAQQKATDAIRRVQDQRTKIEAAIFEEAAKARGDRQEEQLRQEIDRIDAAANQRVITEENAARKINDIEEQIFQQRRIRLIAELTLSAENSVERQKAADDLAKLELERAGRVEQAQLRILEAQRRDLTNLRSYLQERNQLLEDIQQGEVDALNRRASRLEGRAGLGAVSQDVAQVARQQAQVAEEDFLNRQNQARIQAAQVAAENAAQSEAQRLQAAQLANQLLEQEEQRHQEALGQIAVSIISPFDQIKDVLKGAAQGFFETGIAALAAGQSVGQAMRQMAAAVLGQIAKIAAGEAIKNVAYGLNALGWTIFTADPRGALAASHYFASAALWGGLAAGAAIGAGAVGRTSAPSSGGGSQSSANSNNQNGPRVIEQGNRQNETKIIVIRAEYQPGVIVREVKQNYTGNGDLRGTFRSDMLGEPAG